MKIVSCSELLIAILFALSFVVMGAEPESDSDLFWGELSIVENLAFADIAGIGKCVDVTSNDTMHVEMKSYWFGNQETNVLELTKAANDMVELMGTFEIGQDVIFFATTNEWKRTSSGRESSSISAWNFRALLTEVGSPCPPSLGSMSNRAPSWFPVGSNDTETISFVSNLVHTACVSRNLNHYYEALRSALSTTNDAQALYKFMPDAFREMLALESGENEAFLVNALNDPLLSRKFRGMALFNLKKRFGWSETNTVPEL